MKFLESLYLEYGGMVFRRCLAILRNEDEAYDACQEVFLKLAANPLAAVCVRKPFSYLYRSATNAGLNALRSRKRRAAIDLDESVPDLREDRVSAETAMEALADGMPARTREIAFYRYADGLKIKEIMDRTGLSDSGVRKHLAAFRRRALEIKERER